jgi:hypothetical protein
MKKDSKTTRKGGERSAVDSRFAQVVAAFAGHGRRMKEWVAVDDEAADWVALAREARAFVGGGHP